MEESSAAGERASDILTRARAAGFAVSDRQLRRWHTEDEGLIPNPTQTWSERVPGSETIYPRGTADQFVQLCAISQSFHRSKDRGWLLWWLGFPVKKSHWKGALKNSAGWYDAVVPKVLRLLTSQKGIFSILRTARVRNTLFRQLRKRLGPHHFDDFMRFVIDILKGEFDGLDPVASADDEDLVHDKMAIDKGLGLSRARTSEKIKENPHLYDDVEHALRLLSGRLGGTNLVDVLGDCSDEQITSARNELRGIFAIAELANSAAAKGIKDQLGLKVFSHFCSLNHTKLHRLCLLYFLALKEDAAFQQKLDRFFEGFRKMILPVPPLERIDVLRCRDPALAQIMFPQAVKLDAET